MRVEADGWVRERVMVRGCEGVCVMVRGCGEREVVEDM